MKICSICGLEKEDSEFYLRKESNKLRSECKYCHSFQYHLNRTKILKEKKSAREANLAIYIERERKQSRSEAGRAYARNYRSAHREHRLEYLNLWRRVEYKTNPGYKLLTTLRNRFRTALRGGRGVKTLSALSLLGCSIPHLKASLESLFKPGMNWDNWGPVWEIDHIKPCASFDLRDIKQQKACFHWTNLQPLFAEENRRKSNKI